MPTLCYEDQGHGAAVRDTLLCEDCYRTTLERVKREMTRRGPQAVKKAPRRDSRGTADDDRRLATVIARSVVAADGPVTKLHERLRLPKDDALSRAVEIAKSEGWIALDNGRGHVPGPNAPRPRTPEEVGRLVWSAVEPLRAERIAELLGISTRTVQRLITAATAAGWIANVRGKGYRRGAEKPPEIPDVS